MKTFYKYTVEWYFDEEVTTNEGFLLAENWTEAAAIIEARFDMIENIFLEPVNDSDLLDFDDLADYIQIKENLRESFKRLLEMDSSNN